MNKTDLKKIVHKSKSYDYYYDEDENAFLPRQAYADTEGLPKLTIKPLDLMTTAAIANKTAEIVVTDDGSYNPEYEKLIKFYHILKESCGFRLDEFDEEEMYAILLSPIGQLIDAEEFNIPFLHELEVLTAKRIAMRKDLILRDHSVRDKVVELLEKEIGSNDLQIELLEQQKAMNEAFTPEEQKQQVQLLSEFMEIMKKEGFDENLNRIVSEPANKEFFTSLSNRGNV